MHDTVLLEDVRCDGSAHGGCQALCQILWREAWLRRVVTRDERHARPDAPHPGLRPADHERCRVHIPEALEAPLMTTRTSVDRDVFGCQATEIKKASFFLAWWDVRQYIRDWTSGNVGLSEMIRGLPMGPRARRPNPEEDDFIYPWLNSLFLDLAAQGLRRSYSWGVLQGVNLACALGVKRVSVIEFGVVRIPLHPDRRFRPIVITHSDRS